MGADLTIACVTCRKAYYLGYGSYSFIERRKKLFPEAEHIGHDVHRGILSDYMTLEEDGHLYFEGRQEDELAIANYKDFVQVDLSGTST